MDEIRGQSLRKRQCRLILTQKSFQQEEFFKLQAEFPKMPASRLKFFFEALDGCYLTVKEFLCLEFEEFYDKPADESDFGGFGPLRGGITYEPLSFGKQIKDSQSNPFCSPEKESHLRQRQLELGLYGQNEREMEEEIVRISNEILQLQQQSLAAGKKGILGIIISVCCKYIRGWQLILQIVFTPISTKQNLLGHLFSFIIQNGGPAQVLLGGRLQHSGGDPGDCILSVPAAPPTGDNHGERDPLKTGPGGVVPQHQKISGRQRFYNQTHQRTGRPACRYRLKRWYQTPPKELSKASLI